jgi:hypothetical protein
MGGEPDQVAAVADRVARLFAFARSEEVVDVAGEDADSTSRTARSGRAPVVA